MKFYDGFIKRYITALATLSVCVLVLVNSESAAEAVRSGINTCLCSVIPSLFPMIFLSQYLIKSGSAQKIGKLLNKPTEVMFGLPGVCGVAVLTGMFGGFPAGARAAETLTEDGIITRKQGERLALITCCSGPGFTIGMVGEELYGNKSIGLLILTAQIISFIIIGIILKFTDGNLNSRKYHAEPSVEQGRSSDAFVQSAADTASTVIAMCSFIIIFQVISAMLEVLGVSALLSELLGKIGLKKIGGYLLPCLLEVTGGCMLSVSVGLPFTAFVVGFGGLSVHFQNFAICRELRLNKLQYIGVRLVQGLMCELMVSLALKIPYFAEVCAPASAAVIESGVGVHFSQISYSFGVIMLIMCLMSVICLPKSTRGV